ncbi:flavo protein [Calocera viscosa TUFC12733]|uniref:Flavo protein n=1 Tax=Calocera viscosa (strain TUFC12733) TaxID=1330018 RepID=A0A167GB48_CALVF|nr:flavo protein [Calocera viscosa TUFC12733]
MSAPIRIAVLIGSTRKGSNGKGISHWVSSGLTAVAAAHTEKVAVEVIPVDLTSATYKLGPIYEDIVPAGIKDPKDYIDPLIVNWSKFISSCSGFVVVSPQYNWGYPGELKNAFDHLFNEWVGKPIAIVTYGGRGGGKAGEQLRQVTGGGMDMKLVEERVEIKLPREYISGTLRVASNASISHHGTAEDKDSWLQEYQKPLEEAMEALVTAVTAPKAEA